MSDDNISNLWCFRRKYIVKCEGPVFAENQLIRAGDNLHTGLLTRQLLLRQQWTDLQNTPQVTDSTLSVIITAFIFIIYKVCGILFNLEKLHYFLHISEHCEKMFTYVLTDRFIDFQKLTEMTVSRSYFSISVEE